MKNCLSIESQGGKSKNRAKIWVSVWRIKVNIATDALCVWSHFHQRRLFDWNSRLTLHLRLSIQCFRKWLTSRTNYELILVERAGQIRREVLLATSRVQLLNWAKRLSLRWAFWFSFRFKRTIAQPLRQHGLWFRWEFWSFHKFSPSWFSLKFPQYPTWLWTLFWERWSLYFPKIKPGSVYDWHPFGRARHQHPIRELLKSLGHYFLKHLSNDRLRL